MRNSKFVVVALAVLVAFQVACSSLVPATVTYSPTFPFEKNEEIFLMANRQHARIGQSLMDAGLKIADKLGESTYALRVNVGSSRSSSKCGTVNNVAYVLTAEGRRVVVIKGRGATGTCTPNIFDDMSRKLAEQGA